MSEGKTKKELTDKQMMFVKEYLIDLNGKQAAIRCGYSPHTAENQASRLLSIAKVREEVQRQMDDRSEKVSITAEDVLSSIKNIRDKTYADERYQDALRANELLGKHLKLFTDKVEQSGPNGGPIEQKWTIERVKPK